MMEKPTTSTVEKNAYTGYQDIINRAHEAARLAREKRLLGNEPEARFLEGVADGLRQAADKYSDATYGYGKLIKEIERDREILKTRNKELETERDALRTMVKALGLKLQDLTPPQPVGPCLVCGQTVYQGDDYHMYVGDPIHHRCEADLENYQEAIK